MCCNSGFAPIFRCSLLDRLVSLNLLTQEEDSAVCTKTNPRLHTKIPTQTPTSPQPAPAAKDPGDAMRKKRNSPRAPNNCLAATRKKPADNNHRLRAGSTGWRSRKKRPTLNKVHSIAKNKNPRQKSADITVCPLPVDTPSE